MGKENQTSIIDEISLQNGRIIRLVNGDITERTVDAIVNAANSYLKHGGGVAGAIVRRGGHIIQEESDKIGFVPVGNAVVTTAGKLPCKAVIHVVGPMLGEGEEDEKLSLAIKNVLKLAQDSGFNSISIPAISSGIFGFPKDKCAKILVEESVRFVKKLCTLCSGKESFLELVEFCIFDDETLDYFKREFRDLKMYK